MVISGINHGENLGDDVIYSGTVAAAMEGRSLGFPAMAVSALGQSPSCLHMTAQIIQRIVEHLQHAPLASDIILNINVPDCTSAELRGMKSTRLGNRHVSEPVIESQDPRGNKIYWVGAQGSEHDAGEGTDFHAVANHMVSVTPLHLDLTKHQMVEDVGLWLRDFVALDSVR